MRRFVIVVSIIFFMSTYGCTKCSGQKAGESVDNMSTDVGLQQISDIGEDIYISDSTGGAGVMRPNIKFVQTPDGKVVPEAVLRLKLPKSLNPNILKNSAGDQKKETEPKREETR
jgi:hypothetical protein